MRYIILFCDGDVKSRSTVFTCHYSIETAMRICAKHENHSYLIA